MLKVQVWSPPPYTESTSLVPSPPRDESTGLSIPTPPHADTYTAEDALSFFESYVNLLKDKIKATEDLNSLKRKALNEGEESLAKKKKALDAVQELMELTRCNFD